jgi:hypothetical protein
VAYLELNLLPLREVLTTCSRTVGSSSSSKLKRAVLLDNGWTNEHSRLVQKLFDSIEHRISLHIPTPDWDTNVISDASDLYGAGIISQTSPDERYLPVWERTHKLVLFYSAAFTSTEKNYSIAEREFLVFVNTVQRGEILLRALGMIYGYMDNLNSVQAVQSMAKNKATLGRLVRQEAFLRTFPMQIVYLSGEHNPVDLFTRGLEPVVSSAVLADGVVNDVDTFFGHHDHFTRHGTTKYFTRPVPPPALELFDNPDDATIIAACTDLGATINSKGVCILPDGRIVLPRDLVAPMIWLAHESVGHRGVVTTTSVVERDFYFPSMKKEVEQQLLLCLPCAANHRQALEPRSLGEPLVATRVGERFTVDLFSMPQAFNGSTYFSLYQDDLCKFTVTKDQMDRGAAETRKSLELLIQILGHCPDLHSRDGGSEFEGEYNELIRLIGNQTHVHVANWKPSHGASERTGQEIRRAIRIMCSVYGLQENEWPKVLVPVTWIYNRTPHGALGGKCPAEFMP